MKKAISISLSILMLAAILHLSVATHYCRGSVQSSKLSVSGKLADCGMGDEENNFPASDFLFNRHCCDNKLTFLGLTASFIPSFPIIAEKTHDYFQFSYIIDNINIQDHPAFSICKNESPPGLYFPSSVELTSICIFRI